jgi:WD40 repeat protein
MTAFDPKQAKLVSAIAAPGILFALAYDEPHQTLHGAGTDGALYSVDLKAEKPTAERKWQLHANYVSGLVLRNDEIISCGFDRKLIWSDRVSGKPTRTVDAHAGWVRKLAMTPDGETIVTVGDDMLVNFWNAGDGKPVASLSGHDAKTPEGFLSGLYALAMSPDGKFAASGDRAGYVRVWDIERRKQASGFRATDFYTFDAVKRARAIGGVRGLAFSPDGSRLAVSGIGAVTNVDGFVGPSRIELWDWKAEKRVAVGQDKHQAILNHVAYTADGKWLVAAGGGDGGGALMIWAGNETAPHVAKPKGHLQSFVLGSNAKLYACGHAGFQVWQLG